MNEACGSANVLPLPATPFGSQTAVAQAVRSHLLQNADINAVFKVSDVDANAAISGIKQSGKTGQVAVCGINFNEAVLQNIQAGTQACAIDQQGYMEGFLAVSVLNANVNYGFTVPTREILTGPGIVDAANVEQLISGASQGTRQAPRSKRHTRRPPGRQAGRSTGKMCPDSTHSHRQTSGISWPKSEMQSPVTACRPITPMAS